MKGAVAKKNALSGEKREFEYYRAKDWANRRNQKLEGSYNQGFHQGNAEQEYQNL
jgi:hypothetical protein